MAALFLSTNQLKSSLCFLWDTLWLPALRGAPINLSFFSEYYRETRGKIFLSLCFLDSNLLGTNAKRTNPNHKCTWHHPSPWPVLCESSQNHRITDWQGLEGTSVGYLFHPPCQSSITYSRLHRTLSRQVLNISREGDSTTSLGSLFQFSVTLRGKKFFLMFRWNFLCFSLCPLPLVLSLGTTEKSLAPFSWHPPFRYL